MKYNVKVGREIFSIENIHKWDINDNTYVFVRLLIWQL